jgi:hypothetical protein
MTLSMTRPQKHPDSGYYWFRKRVPDDLRSLIGKREEHFSLGTHDPSEAKRLHALKLAEIEERWANLRVGQRPLSPDDINRCDGMLKSGLGSGPRLTRWTSTRISHNR